MKYAAGASEKEIRALADDARGMLIRYKQDECVAEAREKRGFEIIYDRVAGWERADGGRVE